MLTNGMILAISGIDILQPLGIYFRPFANSAHDTKYHNRYSGLGCFCVDKLPTNHILIGHGYGPLDFHAPTKALITYKC